MISKKKSRSRFLIILLFILIVFCLLGGAAFYLYQQPIKKLETFLSHCQTLDIPNISEDIYTGNLTSLEEAGVTDPNYTDFFKKAASFISYDIEKTSFNFNHAVVRTNLVYADASEIFKKAVSDYSKHSFRSSFSGEELASDFSGFLNNYMNELGQDMSYTTIDFYLIKENHTWYVDVSDPHMSNVLSANINEVKKELSSSSSLTVSNEEIPSASPEDTLDLVTDNFELHYSSSKTASDIAGNPCLFVYYEYTNKGTSKSSAMIDVNLTAYQNGTLLEATLPETSDAAIDQYMTDIDPGQSISVCQVFALNDDTTPVILKAVEAYSFTDLSSVQQIPLK